MSGSVRVLQCSQCQMFQGDLVKKSSKWTCKICGLKQDLVKEFLRGSGPECRQTVQHLNLERGKREEQDKEHLLEQANQLPDQENIPTESISPAKKAANKWATYVDAPSETRSRQLGTDTAKNVSENEVLMNYNKSQAANPKRSSAKRPANRETVAAKRSSKWDDFV
ncbi:hypothetical protein KR018_007149 [Drosophila ironensis]|nr:hypothetical protein KR018_007149 [Drosophila ironensis]